MQMEVDCGWCNRKWQVGFTLLELLIVILIMGVVLGAVSLKAAQTNKQILQQDVQRLAALMQLARDEAIVKNQLIALELDTDRYRFFIKNDNGWQVLQDDVLHERIFNLRPIAFSLLNGASHFSSWRLVFGRDPVDQAFVLALQYAQDTYSISADGIGHFRVE
jgi:general secretion pathway protein H